MKQRSLMKRVSAVLMAATLTISTFTQFHTEVHAEENQLPTIEQFATVEELKTFDTNDQDEEGYDVNITASKGLTVKNGTQGVKKGTVITDITVEVTGGYYLPDDYKDTIQGLNGLNVKDFTKTGFTISGTPTSDVSITLPAASEQPFRVILPDEQIGYTLTVDKSEVEYGGSCTLTFALQEGYVKTGDFRIWACGHFFRPLCLYSFYNLED